MGRARLHQGTCVAQPQAAGRKASIAGSNGGTSRAPGGTPDEEGERPGGHVGNSLSHGASRESCSRTPAA
eukprot:11044207-Alexandrium_andersonii.AAC.1